MFKVLVLQQMNNLFDECIEYQIPARLSFMRLLGLELEHRAPDAKTVWLFRERPKGAELLDVLFAVLQGGFKVQVQQQELKQAA